MTKVRCDNCDWEGDDEDAGFTVLADCEYLFERLDPGAEVPAGDCPECRCFCYLVKEPKLDEYTLRVIETREHFVKYRVMAISLEDAVGRILANDVTVSIVGEDAMPDATDIVWLDDYEAYVGGVSIAPVEVRAVGVRVIFNAEQVIANLIEWNKQNGHCVDKPWLDAMRYMGVTENS